MSSRNEEGRRFRNARKDASVGSVKKTLKKSMVCHLEAIQSETLTEETHVVTRKYQISKKTMRKSNGRCLSSCNNPFSVVA